MNAFPRPPCSRRGGARPGRSPLKSLAMLLSFLYGMATCLTHVEAAASGPLLGGQYLPTTDVGFIEDLTLLIEAIAAEPDATKGQQFYSKFTPNSKFSLESIGANASSTILDDSTNPLYAIYMYAFWKSPNGNGKNGQHMPRDQMLFLDDAVDFYGHTIITNEFEKDSGYNATFNAETIRVTNMWMATVQSLYEAAALCHQGPDDIDPLTYVSPIDKAAAFYFGTHEDESSIEGGSLYAWTSRTRRFFVNDAAFVVNDAMKNGIIQLQQLLTKCLSAWDSETTDEEEYEMEKLANELAYNIYLWNKFGLSLSQTIDDVSLNDMALAYNHEKNTVAQSYDDKFAIDDLVTDVIQKSGDFILASSIQRRQVIETLLATIVLPIYALDSFYTAIDTCTSNQIDGQDQHDTSEWDKAVASLVGFLEGPNDGGSDKGILFYNLGQNLCDNAGACENGGDAKVNNLLMTSFKDGQAQLLDSDCTSAEQTVFMIEIYMQTVLLDAVALYAKKLKDDPTNDINLANGYALATALYPLVYFSKSRDDDTDTIIESNLGMFGAPGTSEGLDAVIDALKSYAKQHNTVDCSLLYHVACDSDSNPATNLTQSTTTATLSNGDNFEPSPTVSPKPSSSTYYPTYSPSVTVRPTQPTALDGGIAAGDNGTISSPLYSGAYVPTSNVDHIIKLIGLLEEIDISGTSKDAGLAFYTQEVAVGLSLQTLSTGSEWNLVTNINPMQIIYMYGLWISGDGDNDSNGYSNKQFDGGDIAQYGNTIIIDGFNKNRVNDEMIITLKKLQSNYATCKDLALDDANEVANDMRKDVLYISRLMTIPIVQNFITNLATKSGKTQSERDYLILYSLALLPQLSICDEDVLDSLFTDLVLENSSFNSTKLPETLKIIQDRYDCLGISCSLVGTSTYVDTSWPPCVDHTDPGVILSIAGYEPFSKASSELSKIDLDVSAILSFIVMEANDAAFEVYANGRNVIDSSGSFISILDLKLPNHPSVVSWYSKFNGDYGVNYLWLTESAIRGVGNFASTSPLQNTAAAGLALVTIDLHFGILENLYQAVKNCRDGTDPLVVRALWDRAVALTVGWAEGQSEFGSKTNGYLFFQIAQEVCNFFNSCDSSGNSEINNRLISGFTNGAGLISLSKCDSLEEQVGAIETLLRTIVLDNLAYHIDSAESDERDYLLAHCLTYAILPFIRSVDEPSADVLERNLGTFPTKIYLTSGKEAVYSALEAYVDAEGIDCDLLAAVWIGNASVSDEGSFLYELAEQLGPYFSQKDGDYMATLNSEIISRLNLAQTTFFVDSTRCKTDGNSVKMLRKLVKEIVSYMTAVIIQGFIHSMLEENGTKDKGTFVELYFLSFLPHIARCGRDDLKDSLYDDLVVRSFNPFFSPNIIDSIHSLLNCLGLRCKDIGRHILADDSYPKCVDNLDLLGYSPANGTRTNMPAKLDLDAVAIHQLMSMEKYSLASEIYLNGLNYYDYDNEAQFGFVSLHNLTQSATIGNTDFDTYKLYTEYLSKNPGDFVDGFIMDAFEHNDKFNGTTAKQRELAVSTAIKLFVSYLSALEALNVAVSNCETNTERSITAWDGGAALLIGSVEGTESGAETVNSTKDGRMFYSVSNALCDHFDTCTQGGSTVSDDLLALLTQGQDYIYGKSCSDVTVTLKSIVQLCTVSLIQSALYFADESSDDDNLAAGYIASMAVLPFVDEIDPDAATTIKKDLSFRPSSIDGDSSAVLNAFRTVLSNPLSDIDCEMISNMHRLCDLDAPASINPDEPSVISDGLYVATSFVTDRSYISLDISDITDKIKSDLRDQAIDLYRNGANSPMYNANGQLIGKRSVSKFSTDSANIMKENPFYNLFLFGLADENYEFIGRPVTMYADSFVIDLLYSNDRQEQLAAPNAMVVLNVWMEVIQKLYSAYISCKSTLLTNGRHLEEGDASLLIDEAAAYWIGDSQEMGSSSQGHLLYALTEFIGEKFEDIPQGSQSSINSRIIDLINQAKSHISITKSCSTSPTSHLELRNIIEELVPLMAVPLLRGLFYYLSIRDATKTKLYALSVLPLFSTCSKSTFLELKSDLIDSNLIDVEKDYIFSRIRSMYDCLGMSCDMVGFMPRNNYTHCQESSKNNQLAGFSFVGDRDSVIQASPVDAFQQEGIYLTATPDARRRAISFTMRYMVMYMAALEKLYATINLCRDSNKPEAYESLDAAAAFIIGRSEGEEDGGSYDGVLLFMLANRMCVHFKTCSPSNNAESNERIISLFYAAQGEIAVGACDSLDKTIRGIENALVIPLIQGTLFTALQNDLFTKKVVDAEDYLPEGQVLAQCVLPLVHDVDSSAAKDIESVMVTGFPNHEKVFRAMQSAIPKMKGLDCTMVGTLAGVSFCPGVASTSNSGSRTREVRSLFVTLSLSLLVTR
ncbi:hypothetical protein ACHAWX_007338 [Stephanocyclus meneghinianus]